MLEATYVGDIWKAVAVVGGAVVPAATLALAAATVYLARYTRDVSRQADRHHQENARPFCGIEFDHMDASNPFGREFPPKPPVVIGAIRHPGRNSIRICGRLYNKGTGPAKDVHVHLNQGSSFDGSAVWLTRPVVAAPVLGVAEEMPIDILIEEEDVMPFVNEGKWIPTQVFHAIARDAYEVVVSYNDVFENPFRTVHPRGFPQDIGYEVAAISGDREKQKALATRPNRASAVFLKDRQPWFTLADAYRASRSPHSDVQLDSTLRK